MRNILIVAILLMLIHSLLYSQNNPSIPVTWKKTEACGVSFYLPPNMTSPYQGPLGLDECAEEFQSDTMRIFLETDPFPFEAKKPAITRFDNLAQKSDFKRIETKIKSRKAIIVSYYESSAGGFNFHLALSIAVAGGLRMFVSMKKEEDKIVAEQVFRSMTLTEKSRASNNGMQRTALADRKNYPWFLKMLPVSDQP